MQLLPNLQKFLDELELIQAQLAQIGFKLNHANVREGLTNLTPTTLVITAIYDTYQRIAEFLRSYRN